ncbi:5-oxoprolinase/urea amidolyase family protein [Microbacterium sp. NPDC076911]|uniref:5-oxoprolinase subunit B/C family protein n=1 Tax=Microbacterium sp. NPDC076911 TaxID=3154958 RepID=UPI0034407D0A
MVTVRALPMGESAFLLEVSTLDEVLATHAALAASRAAGVIDLVPAARTVLVRVDPRTLSVAAARAWALDAASTADTAAQQQGELQQVDIVYNGADLADTAALLGVTAERLIDDHLSAEWTVAFTGFAPGFGYLVSADWPHDVARLDAPRTRVPVGAVGLAGGFSGAYPRETPGGWRLIGATDAPLFVPEAERPALLNPGMRVRFRRVDALAPTTPVTPATGGTALDDPTAIRVVEPGLLATLQDLGRPGAASLGVAPSGALDRRALSTANRLLGNAETAAAIEVTMGGFRARAERDLWIAFAGASGAATLDGHPVDPYRPVQWLRGQQLHLDWFTRGARAYLAVRGGWGGPTVLGSRASDVLAGLGEPPLRSGDQLSLSQADASPIPPVDLSPWEAPHDGDLDIELAEGPRADWFDERARATFFDTVWVVSNNADRVGIRLDGPPLARERVGELPSEGMMPGAIQVPPSGQPTVLMADGPVTGGYPVIAVVTDAALSLLGQARPGTRVRFRHAPR